MAINLLPTDLSPKAPAIKLAKSLKNLVIAGFVIFILGLMALIGYFIFISTELSSSAARQEQLKTGIKSLQETEQRLVLTKDRLKYVKEVLGETSATDDLEQLETLLLNLPEGVSLNRMDVGKDKVELTLLAANSLGVTQSLASLTAAGLYQRIVLLSFSFNPDIGYLVTLELSH